MKRNLKLGCSILLYVFCLALLVGCDGQKPNDDNPTNATKSITITYDANGGVFSGVTTTTQKVNANSLLTAPGSPTRQNYIFSGWSKTKNGSNLWDFANDTAMENVTLYAVWKSESARILSVEGATITNLHIYLLVDKDTEIVSLSNKVICGDDSAWKLYYDTLGQMEIPTKIAASSSGSLKNGRNEFFIVVTSKDGTQTNLYTLEVYRSYSVNVTYYVNNNVINTDTAYTGYEYTIDYKPILEGYKFNYWQDEQGNEVSSTILVGTSNFFANITANSYKCNIDVNGGNKLDTTEYTFTYAQQFVLPVPTRQGYTFLGWYADELQITKANGESLDEWNSLNRLDLVAKWQIKRYNVTITSSDINYGVVTDGGEYDYGSDVTITATPNIGCNFNGWYDSSGKLVTKEASYTFYSVTKNFDLQALFAPDEALSNFNFKSTLTTCEIIELKDKTVSEIILPEYITSIDYKAFVGSSNLETVYWNAVSCMCVNYSPQYLMFSGCLKLTTIVVGENVTSIVGSAFSGCNSLTGVYYEGNIEGWCNINFATSSSSPLSYAQNLYINNELITELVIPDTVTEIKPYAFCGCRSLTSLKIGNSVTIIGDSAFNYCKKISSLSIPTSVTSIGSYAFSQCNIASISFEGTVDQWHAVYTGANWCQWSSTEKVICSDGEAGRYNQNA